MDEVISTWLVPGLASGGIFSAYSNTFYGCYRRIWRYARSFRLALTGGFMECE